VGRRNLEELARQVKDEARAYGAQGIEHYSFDFIRTAINNALDTLAGIFTIRDEVSFKTKAVEIEEEEENEEEPKEIGKNEYKLSEILEENYPEITVENIISVTYDGKQLNMINPERFLKDPIPDEGSVRSFFLWGEKFYLIGEVEPDKEVRLWVTRAPKHLVNDDDVPEVPYYAEEALVHYAISSCYRESRDYERANYHFGIYDRKKQDVIKRANPQGHRTNNARVKDDYFPAFGRERGLPKTDTNPGGRSY